MSITGYYDGNVCIPLDKSNLKPNQKVVITLLDEFISPQTSGLSEKEKRKIFDKYTGSIKRDIDYKTELIQSRDCKCEY